MPQAAVNKEIKTVAIHLEARIHLTTLASASTDSHRISKMRNCSANMGGKEVLVNGLVYGEVDQSHTGRSSGTAD